MNTIIEKESLFPYIHNCLSCSVDKEGKLIYNRFTSEQYDIYKAFSEQRTTDYLSRAKASSNVSFEANTDSSFISLHFTWKGFTFLNNNIPDSKLCSVDLLVDDQLFDSFSTIRESIDMWTFKLPEGKHNIKVIFPWSAEFYLTKIQLSNECFVEPVKQKSIKLLCFGDSITQGYISTHPSMSYVSQVATKLNAEVLNQAIGGFFFDEKVLDSKLKSFNPDLITIAYGTNDFSIFGDNIDHVNEKAEKYIVKIKTIFPKTRTIGILPIYRNDPTLKMRTIYRGYELASWVKNLEKMYQNNGIETLEDTYMPHSAEAYAADYLHPSNLGFCFYANALLKKISNS